MKIEGEYCGWYHDKSNKGDFFPMVSFSISKDGTREKEGREIKVNEVERPRYSLLPSPNPLSSYAIFPLLLSSRHVIVR